VYKKQSRTFNLRCPKCGNEEAFRIIASKTIKLFDLGEDDFSIDDTDEGFEWEYTSYAACNTGGCDWFGTVGQLQEHFEVMYAKNRIRRAK